MRDQVHCWSDRVSDVVLGGCLHAWARPWFLFFKETADGSCGMLGLRRLLHKSSKDLHPELSRTNESIDMPIQIRNQHSQ